MTDWNHQDTEALYNVPGWSLGFFGINAKGNVEVRPDGDDRGPCFDLHELMQQIGRRGVAAPTLVRFDGILRTRVRKLNEAFNKARAEYNYDAPYRLVFPIKVNQERHVVEALMDEGRKHGMGLEAGSKPELLATIALQAGEDSLVVCNGYKDDEYIEMALLASKLGTTPVIVIEKYSELGDILRLAKQLDIEPVLGVRSKLSYRGAGRWHESGGDRSKFGLTTGEIVQAVEELKRHDMLHCLKLLHFHLGSQITKIRSLKGGLREAAHTLVGLAEMGAKIEYFDVGGGLGIDYDGSSSTSDSSMNYTEQEYAADVVSHVAEACAEANIPQPTLISESGRALTAHHSVLITEVLGVSEACPPGNPIRPAADEADVVHSMAEVHDNVTETNFLEFYHDAVEIREEAMLLFNVGNLTIPQRARVEEFYWRTCKKIGRIVAAQEYAPEELESLQRDLADNYFLNFSLFQSVPDSWAIQHLFPIVPIHRGDTEPTRRGVIADVTCDSDGKVDRFIDPREVKRTLELHPFTPGEPYLLGFFLIGAYQEILGDMHNLFGDSNVVHIDADAKGRPKLRHVMRGDRVKDVLSYVGYVEKDLLRDLRSNLETALDEGRISFEESALIWERYESGLHGYTYLTRDRQKSHNPSHPLSKETTT